MGENAGRLGSLSLASRQFFYLRIIAAFVATRNATVALAMLLTFAWITIVAE
jgi:hypothetical protein